ncbi:transcription termination factor 1, mitochondrial-like [Hyperolius riggenbachi]|uniref:transcription termination factor 1, mitochondrial-like n=1 Tax=Hyperolius riggenbachi TaxID=752182 RepID=UPI0035A339D2
MALKVLINITGNYLTALKSPCRTGVIRLGLFRILWGWTYVGQRTNHESKTENVLLVQNFEAMGVDIAKNRKCCPTLYKNTTATNEAKLKEFLLGKGADMATAASIISRCPRAVTTFPKDLSEIWDIWENILKPDYSVLKVVTRSPESFFRSGGIEKLMGNISYFQSIGVPPKLLSQLMAQAPRTFSNSIELNKQKVDFLRELSISLEEEDPEKCIIQIITSNIFILTKSLKRVKANLESIRSLMKLKDKELLSWIQGEGAFVLGLCYTYIENNFVNVQKIMQSLGCVEADVSQCIVENPYILLLSPKIFACKVNLLMNCGIEATQILDTPLVLGVSLASLKYKIKLLRKCGYDFKNNTLGVLLCNRATFDSRVQRLSRSTDQTAKQS